MSFRDRFRPDLRAAATLVGGGGIVPTTSGALPLVSRFATDHDLARVAWTDIYGDLSLIPVTRAEAMAVPAMARARHIIAGTIARVQLRGYAGDQLLGGDQAPAAPPWLTQTGNGLSAFHRNLWTADDLIFYGWSCWRRVNSTYDGRPLKMYRVPVGQWSVGDGVVYLHDGLNGTPRPAHDGEVKMIPGPHEGLLSFAAGSIRHAADLQRAAGVAAATPAANLVLQQTAGDPIPDADIDKLIARWATARRGENGGVAWASKGVDVKELGAFDAHLLTDGRNAAAVDIARHASLPADLVDATTDGSLTYSTSRDNDRRGIDYGTGLYMGAISASLSEDDTTPHGQRVAFDVEEWLAGTVPGQPASAPAPQQPAAAPAPAPATTGEPTL